MKKEYDWNKLVSDSKKCITYIVWRSSRTDPQLTEVSLYLKNYYQIIWLYYCLTIQETWLLKQELSIKAICSVCTQEGFFFVSSWGHCWHNWLCWKTKSGNSWIIRPVFLIYLPPPQLKCWKYTLLDAINVMIHFSYQKLKSITSFNVFGIFLAFFNLWEHILWEHKVIAKYPFSVCSKLELN